MNINDVVNGIKKHKLRILEFDLETTPREAYVWETGKQYISDVQLKKGTSILTWAAKWLCDDKIYYGYATPCEARERRDKRILKPLWKLLDQADIITAHNVDGFDRKRFNTRCIINGYDPVSPYDTIDTLKQARKHFDFTRNTLKRLCIELGLREKKKTNEGLRLWAKCVDDDYKTAKKAIQTMLAYNIQDVRAGEDLYFKLRPWMTHPNLNVYCDDIKERCTKCLSDNLSIKGKYRTNTNWYNSVRCNDCGSYGRQWNSGLTSAERKKIIRTLP